MKKKHHRPKRAIAFGASSAFSPMRSLCIAQETAWWILDGRSINAVTGGNNGGCQPGPPPKATPQ